MGTPEPEGYRKPCLDRFIDDIGEYFVFGAVTGSAFHLIKGTYNSPKGSRFFRGIEAVSMNAPRLGGSFAAWGALYCTSEYTMEYLRQKKDPWNSIISGAATSGFLSMRKGLGRASTAAVVGGCAFALFEGAEIMLNKFLAQPRNIKTDEPGMPRIQMGQMQNQTQMMSESQNQNTTSSSSSWLLFGKKNEEIQPGNGSKTEVMESFDAPPVPSYDYE